jgi:hypothetical protein
MVSQLPEQASIALVRLDMVNHGSLYDFTTLHTLDTQGILFQEHHPVPSPSAVISASPAVRPVFLHPEMKSIDHSHLLSVC